MSQNLQLGHDINDNGQQVLGVAFEVGKCKDGRSNLVKHMHCALCGERYYRGMQKTGTAKCPSCQGGAVVEIDGRRKIDPPSAPEIRLTPLDVAERIKHAGIHVAGPHMLKFAMTTAASRKMIEGGKRKGLDNGPPLPAAATVVKVRRKNGVDSNQQQLALEDGHSGGWTGNDIMDTAEAVRAIYVEGMGLQERATEWAKLPAEAKMAWLAVVNGVVERFEAAQKSGSLDV